MSEYVGKDFDHDLYQVGSLIVVVLLALLVCAFFLGRCSAKYEVRTPVVEKAGERV